MNYIIQIKKLIRKKHFNQEFEEEKVIVNGGLTPSEIKDFKSKLPKETLPEDIEKLIGFSSGIKFPKLDDEISFSEIGYEIEDVILNPIRLSKDGYGNVYYLSIDTKGNWNEVYYVDFKSTKKIKIANNLEEFISILNEYSQDENQFELPWMETIN